MDEENLCCEYIVGCCPYEAFAIGSITKDCPRTHSSKHKNAYADGECSPTQEQVALNTYREIIADVDKKVISIKQCLENIQNFENVYKALDHTELLIEEKKLEEESAGNARILLKVHGSLIEAILAVTAPTNYSICQVCGAIKTGANCKHHFCSVYARIRLLCQHLENKAG